MRVLVTGGTGFVGSHTVAALARDDHEIRLLARDPDKVERVFAPRDIAIDDVVVGDVTDAETVAKAMDGCDAVIHAAALVALRATDAAKVLATNQRAQSDHKVEPARGVLHQSRQGRRSRRQRNVDTEDPPHVGFRIHATRENAVVETVDLDSQFRIHTAFQRCDSCVGFDFPARRSV